MDNFANAEAHQEFRGMTAPMPPYPNRVQLRFRQPTSRRWKRTTARERKTPIWARE